MAQRVAGIVKWFNEPKGYGFITGSDSIDVFVHYSMIRGAGFRTLHEDDRVEYEVIRGEKGLQAQDVVVVGRDTDQYRQRTYF